MSVEKMAKHLRIYPYAIDTHAERNIEIFVLVISVSGSNSQTERPLIFVSLFFSVIWLL